MYTSVGKESVYASVGKESVYVSMEEENDRTNDISCAAQNQARVEGCNFIIDIHLMIERD